MHQELVLDIRRDARGNKFLHFPFMTISDVHLGTRHSRAKKLSHMLEHTNADNFYIIGDFIDGEYMRKKKRWNFPDAHRQVIGHVCRKADRGCRVTYIPGNHDDGIRFQKAKCDGLRRLHRNLCGKTICGIAVKSRAFYTDPKGRVVKLKHGDQYDPTLSSCGGLGDAALEGMSYIDGWFQQLPGCSHISLASKGKRVVKKIVDRVWSIGKNIEKDIDEDPSVGAIVFGHSHMSEIRRTPKGKLVLNDGCCTEHVEALVQDREGNFAILEWHQSHLKITQEFAREDGKSEIRQRLLSWKELGLDSFHEPPSMIEDEYSEKADRLIRLVYRMWPPKERKNFKKIAAFARATEEAGYGMPDRAKRHFHKKWSRAKYRRIKKAATEMRAAGEIARSTGYLPLPNPSRDTRRIEAVLSLRKARPRRMEILAAD